MKQQVLAFFGNFVFSTLKGRRRPFSACFETQKYQTSPRPSQNSPTLNTSNMMAKTILHPADTRGHAHHGWLDSHHTFSFADYHHSDRIRFGVLRVLNDDIVAPGHGFPKHGHDNMEIISIPLSGDLEHEDSMGTKATIRQGDIQVMSAGTGIRHSEKNASDEQEVRFLQIWLFPNRQGVTPRYDQYTYDRAQMQNHLLQILSPKADDAGVWIHQDAWFFLGELEAGFQTEYRLRLPHANGVYAFVLSGDVTIHGQALHTRDGFGIWDTERFEIHADSPAQLLLMEVPMIM